MSKSQTRASCVWLLSWPTWNREFSPILVGVKPNIFILRYIYIYIYVYIYIYTFGPILRSQTNYPPSQHARKVVGVEGCPSLKSLRPLNVRQRRKGLRTCLTDWERFFSGDPQNSGVPFGIPVQPQKGGTLKKRPPDGCQMATNYGAPFFIGGANCQGPKRFPMFDTH